MNIENIKTKKQFYEFADIWYQRTIMLAGIWQDNEESIKRRLKALILWQIMFERMKEIIQISIQLSQPRPIKNFKEGGIILPSPTIHDVKHHNSLGTTNDKYY